MNEGHRRPGRLTLDDRCDIEAGIARAYSMAEIGRRLGVATSTVTREVRANRVPSSPRHRNPLAPDCARLGSCGRPGAGCGPGCGGWLPRACERLDSAPFCCNACAELRLGCRLGCMVYDAYEADRLSRERRSESRSGIAIARWQLAEMDALVTPLVRRGQSPAHIWAQHGAELPVCERTYYNYVRAGAVGAAAIELPRAVRFRPRKKRPAPPRCDLRGREFSDFAALGAPERAGCWQMDCVEGRRGERRAILTLTRPACELQLHVLLEAKDQASVRAALDGLEAALGGPEAFARVFDPLLTDRGPEFLDPDAVETSSDGSARRCRVSCCDPRRSDQKGCCERARAELRRILPKGSSLAGPSASDVALASSHLNSYRRPSLGWVSLLEACAGEVPAALLEALGVRAVAPDEVVMSPDLLAHVAGIAPKGGRRR